MSRTSLASAIVIVVLVAFHFWSLDGLHGNLFLLLAGDDSTYSENYGEARFRSIEIGDTEESVVDLLGEPLDVETTDDPGVRILHFSVSPLSTHYRIRGIEVDNGIVVRKHALAWVD